MTKLSRAFLGRISEKGSLRQNGPWRISCFAQNFYLKNFFNSINFDCTLTAAANSVQKSFQKNERKMQLKRWRRRTKENHLKSHFNKLTKLKGHLGWNLSSSLPKLIPFKKIRKNFSKYWTMSFLFRQFICNLFKRQLQKRNVNNDPSGIRR